MIKLESYKNTEKNDWYIAIIDERGRKEVYIATAVSTTEAVREAISQYTKKNITKINVKPYHESNFKTTR